MSEFRSAVICAAVVPVLVTRSAKYVSAAGFALVEAFVESKSAVARKRLTSSRRIHRNVAPAFGSNRKSSRDIAVSAAIWKMSSVATAVVDFRTALGSPCPTPRGRAAARVLQRHLQARRDAREPVE